MSSVPEGIALLSMYGDEEDEMEIFDWHAQKILHPDALTMKEGDVDFRPQNSPKENFCYRTSSSPQQDEKFPNPRRMPIVDYGHPMSPQAEDGVIQVMYGELLQTIQASEESRRADDVSTQDQNDVDPMIKFLSLPPKDKCSEALQVKIKKFLRLKKTDGISFNSEVRNRKEYRNPDFLVHAVTYQAIDQIGSCFPKDVFDPHGYDKSDFYDQIEANMRREMERREQERKNSHKVDFTSSGGV